MCWLGRFFGRRIIRNNCHQVIAISRPLVAYCDSAHVFNAIPLREAFARVLTRNHVEHTSSLTPSNSPCAFYFIGKIVWAKGFDYLCRPASGRDKVQLDVYGSGPDRVAIEQKNKQQLHNNGGILLNFKGPLPSNSVIDQLREYKVFVNCSVSEGVCNTTIEALAMNKFVILPVHPSNEIFYIFANTLTYYPQNPNSFWHAIDFASSHEPDDISREVLETFSADKINYRLLKLFAHFKSD
jgi:hypothetical protein